MAYDGATGLVVVFGGNGNSGYLADTWTYNGTTWTQQNPAASPSARNNATMTYDAATGQVVLFGGYNANGFLSDTWTYDGTTWTQQSPATSPSARIYTTTTYDAATGLVVLFGGYDGSTYLGDTWTYDGTTWAQQSPATSPSARYLFTTAYSGATGQVVLFGGYNGSGYLSDTWTYNGTTWTQQSTATSPTVRDASAMAYDAPAGQIVLFGGYNSSTGNLGDTWTYNGTMWSQQSPVTSPAARQSPMTVYDVATGQLLLFGGSNGLLLGDTWTYQVSAVANSSAVGTAAAQTAVYFTINTGGTLPALSQANVLTMGASGLDFTLGTGSTCTGAVSSGQTCTVNVAFTPKYPGQRMGAVNLINSTGTVIATTYISGTGTGPLATLSPGLLSTVAGSGTQCSPPGTAACGDGASAIAGTAHLDLPIAVAVDGAGNLYFADSGSNRIRKVTAATGILSTVAGTGTRCSPTATCGDGASATATGAYLYDPTGIAVDGAGNLYIADKFDHRIRKVTAATGFLSTVAGTGTQCSSSTATCGDGASATATGSNLNYPEGVAVDGAGNLYIADSSDHRIRKVTAATGILSTVAGTGTACSSSTATCGDGASATATGSNLNFPSNVAVDGTGNLYIADSSDNRIRKVTAATGFLSTVAGTGTICGSTTSACGDGASATATGASFNNVFGIAVDGAGNLYIADEGDNRIRKVAAATGILSTVAGSGTSCSPVGTGVCGDGTSATATSAEFYYPYGVAVDAAGNLYIADEIDERIRKVTATAGLAFPTATAAGSADTTDGTETVLLNNIGNAPLTLTSQTENSSNFVLGNLMTGGCVSNGSVAAGDSCVIGATFAPQTGQSGLLIGTVATTDNSLNAAGAVQNLTLSGATSTGAIAIAVNQVVTTAGTASVLMGFQYGYTGAPDAGARTITVGSSSYTGAVSCVYKNSHANCSFNYAGPELMTVNGNGYVISVSIAASGSYALGSGTNLLYVNAATTQGGGRSGAPVSGFVATPVVVPRGLVVEPVVSLRPMAVGNLVMTGTQGVEPEVTDDFTKN